MNNKELTVSQVDTIAKRTASKIGSVRFAGYANPVRVTASGSLIWFTVPGNYSGTVPTTCAIGLSYAGKLMGGNKAASACLDESFIKAAMAAVLGAL